MSMVHGCLLSLWGLVGLSEKGKTVVAEWCHEIESGSMINLWGGFVEENCGVLIGGNKRCSRRGA